MPGKKSNAAYQEILDGRFGKGICTLINRTLHENRSSGSFDLLWSTGERKLYKVLPLNGPPSKCREERRLRMVTLGRKQGQKQKGVKLGFRNGVKEELLRRLAAAGTGIFDVVEVYHKHDHDKTRTFARVKWFTTGEISEHDAFSLIDGRKRNPPSLVQAAKENTCLARYGVNNPTKNREIRLKAARNANRTFSIEHWKTHETLDCQGLYEYVVAEHLNSLHVDFDFQVVWVFDDKSTFTVDFFVPTWDTYIEVKGMWYEDAKVKWDRFVATHPNSELWTQKVLKEKGLYRRYLHLWRQHHVNNQVPHACLAP